jgi:hypothetical protein
MKDMVDRIQELLLLIEQLRGRIEVLEDTIRELQGNSRKRSL